MKEKFKITLWAGCVFVLLWSNSKPNFFLQVYMFSRSCCLFVNFFPWRIPHLSSTATMATWSDELSDRYLTLWISLAWGARGIRPIASREIKFDVTRSYVKRQTAKMKLLPSVFNSRVNIFVFVAISRRHFCIFMWFNEGFRRKEHKLRGYLRRLPFDVRPRNVKLNLSCAC